MTLVQPSPELQVHIRKSLNEDLKTRDRDVESIKEWLRQQPHLPNTWGKTFTKNLKNFKPNLLDEQRILTFLRGCSFSLEKCKRKLDMYFTMRAALPEFFADRDITRPELQELVKIGFVIHFLYYFYY